MADVSKIRVDGVDYDVKDTTARNLLAAKVNSKVTLLQDITVTDAALAQEAGTVGYYGLSGENYVGTDLPDTNYKYSNAIILKRYGNITIILFGWSSYPKIAIRYYTVNSNTWSNWFTINTTEVTSA